MKHLFPDKVNLQALALPTLLPLLFVYQHTQTRLKRTGLLPF